MKALKLGPNFDDCLLGFEMKTANFRSVCPSTSQYARHLVDFLAKIILKWNASILSLVKSAGMCTSTQNTLKNSVFIGHMYHCKCFIRKSNEICQFSLGVPSMHQPRMKGNFPACNGPFWPVRTFWDFGMRTQLKSQNRFNQQRNRL